jgi:hypothetical protein
MRFGAIRGIDYWPDFYEQNLHGGQGLPAWQEWQI